MVEPAYRLGQPVQFTTHLTRTTTSGRGRAWIKTLQPPDTGPIHGMIIGKRTYQDGEVEWEDHYRYFVSSKRYTVYLVVTNLYQNPVPVLPEDILTPPHSPGKL